MTSVTFFPLLFSWLQFQIVQRWTIIIYLVQAVVFTGYATPLQFDWETKSSKLINYWPSNKQFFYYAKGSNPLASLGERVVYGHGKSCSIRKFVLLNCSIGMTVFVPHVVFLTNLLNLIVSRKIVVILKLLLAKYTFRDKQLMIFKEVRLESTYANFFNSNQRTPH